ncbi:MAG: hypothetical protein FJ196_03460 [Gammaproteobacteria bacterium]|nr:hypothetical protein [Gammaproteobacteria bacterium]
MILAMRRLPFDTVRIVTGLLAVAIGVQVAWLVTGAFGAHSSARVMSKLRPNSSTLNPFEAIKAAQLFGTLEPGTANASTLVPVSTDGLVLVGVLASTDRQASRAIISESAGAARVYAIGATVPGGSQLAAVYPDRVLLNRGASVATLPLPRQGGIPGVGSAGAMPVIDALAPPASGSAVDNLANAIRWQAVFRSDKPTGVRIYPGADARQFSNLGLQSGDLILTINDAPLSDQANVEQFIQLLASAPQARLSIERSGRLETVIVDLPAFASSSAQRTPP